VPAIRARHAGNERLAVLVPDSLHASWDCSLCNTVHFPDVSSLDRIPGAKKKSGEPFRPPLCFT